LQKIAFMNKLSEVQRQTDIIMAEMNKLDAELNEITRAETDAQ